MSSPVVIEQDDRLVIEWTTPKPPSFEIAAEAFTSLIDQINDLRDEVERLLRPS